MPTVAVDADLLARLVRTVEALASEVAGLRAEVAGQSLQIHRSEATLRTKVVAPVQRLTVKEAAERLRKDVRTVERLLARRLFTDSRGHKRNGCPWLLYCDEIDAYHECGEEGLRMFRQRMGRT